jgi:hypothetical protein
VIQPESDESDGLEGLDESEAGINFENLLKNDSENPEYSKRSR